jgi:hypothetical protein
MKAYTCSLTILTLVSACSGTVADATSTGGNGSVIQVGGSSTSGGGSALGGLGTGGNVTSTGGAPATVCTSASDCALADGCCTCMAYAKGQGVADCAMACSQTACAKMGITASNVTCVAGRCVLDKRCDARLVQCNSAPPPCAAGRAAIVENGCYGTACIDVDQCAAVTSCSVCDAAGLACVTDQLNSVVGDDYHCISVPSSCAQNPTCQCVGACQPNYQCANRSSTALVCQCPMC